MSSLGPLLYHAGKSLGNLGCVHVFRKRSLGGIDHRGETGGIIDGHFSELTAINFNSGQSQALDEAVVGHAFGAHGRVDAGDPQLAEIVLPLLAVAVVVDEGMGDLFLGLR